MPAAESTSSALETHAEAGCIESEPVPSPGATATLARTRNSKCAFLREPASSSVCDSWTVHSLRLFLRGLHVEETLAALRVAFPALRAFGRRRVDRATGEVSFPPTPVQFDFADPCSTALLPLAAVAASLQRFRWCEYSSLRVNRLDLASDHLVSRLPGGACDRIGLLHLPYCHPYRGPKPSSAPWFGVYHRSGKTRAWKVEVAHYPRLESLLHRHPEASAAAVEYCRGRVRQEVRFRGQGLRRRLGGGPMTPEAVFGSLAALVEFAERRLRPVSEAGILPPPPRDLEGEAALAAVTGRRPRI